MLLVTGITGHSGGYFLKELLENKYEGPIRCIVLKDADTKMLEDSGLNIEIIEGDLEDQELLDKAMTGVDTVVHIAAIFYSVNVIRAAVRNNVRRAIFVHTTGIYSKYKSASEEYKNIESTVRGIIKGNKSSIGLIILRPTMIYGNINDRNMIVFIKMVDKLRLFPIIDQGRSLLQPVNGRDLGRAYYQVLNEKSIMNGDYTLSGEKPITMVDMFKVIGNALDKKTMFFSVPLAFGVFLARSLKLLTIGKVDFIERVQRMGENRSFSHDKAAEDFGYKPMPFAEGIKIEVEEYLNRN